MPVTTVRILFRWFPLILDEFLHEISYIRKIISLYFYACIKRLKRSSDATWTSVSTLMLACYSSNEHWWRQKCPLLLFWEPLMSTTHVATITVATDQISPMATIEITLVAAVLVCSSGSKLNLQVHAQLEPLHHPYQLGSGVAASIGASSSRWG
jgi:hypothetical protein